MTHIRHAVLGSLLCASLSALLSPVIAAQARTADALMGAAQHAEDVDGDLDTALATYQQVVAHPNASRTLRASALLRIGRLHEKRGPQEARRTYERITKEFADETSAVAEARRRLSALAGPAAPPDDTQVVARQIWAGREVDPFGSISPDGRSYAFVDWTTTATGNVAVRDVTTGQVRHLTNARTVKEGFAEWPEWSADGRQLAYVFNERLHVAMADGSGARAIFTRPGAHVGAIRWSPDGRNLALAISNYGSQVTHELAVIAVDTGTVVRTHDTGSANVELGGYGPDGRHVAFATGETADTRSTGIHLVEVETGKVTELLQGPGRKGLPTWSPDGKDIVFHSDRSGALGLWAVASDSQGSTQPRLLRDHVGEIGMMRFSRDGTLWYGLARLSSDVYVCTFDPESLTVTSTPTRLSDRFVGISSAPSWSPDGRSIAFMRGTDRRKRTVIVRSLDTGTERELTAPLADTIHASNWGAAWLPDGSAVLVTSVDFATSRFVVQRTAVDGSGARPALDGDFAAAWPHVKVSPDGQWLYYTRRHRAPTIEESRLALVRRAVSSGQEQELYTADSLGAVGFFGLAVSPDGRSLVFSRNAGDDERHLEIVPATGGPARTIYRGSYVMPMPGTGGFTPDGKYVLITGRPSGAPPSSPPSLWVVSIDGSAPRDTGLPWRAGIGAVSLSPDGRRLAFTGTERSGEVWTLRNLLPPAPRNARR